jgi:hypothetical protein
MQANYQRLLTNLGALITWFAVCAQLVLTLQHSTTPVAETLIRFFSYFTILTNTLVAIFFTCQFFPSSRLYKFFAKESRFTALAVYITLVGLTYQVLLRSVWHPQGFQIIIDELLHSLIPIFFVLYWLSFSDKKQPQWKQIPGWSTYLLCYSIYILTRGALTDHYPYPFIDVTTLGYPVAAVNTIGIFALFTLLSGVFVFIAKRFSVS